MTTSPTLTKSDSLSFQLGLASFARSYSWMCFLAAAVKVSITQSGDKVSRLDKTFSEEEGGSGASDTPPTVWKGKSWRRTDDGSGSISKVRSNGKTPGHERERLGFSISSFAFDSMYPVVASAGYNEQAHPSLMKWCIIFLLFSVQQKAWSPY